jgi:hypothetical protein
MPFTNEVIGTNGVLIRNWLQSANYVAGASGWQITKAGNAEFNNGTFRGSLQVGTSPGKRFIVNNSITGDVIDIYDSSNRLVFSVDNNGIVTQNDYSLNQSIQIDGAVITFDTIPSTLGVRPQVFANLFPPSNIYSLSLNSGVLPGGSGAFLSQIDVRGSTDGVTHNENAYALQRNVTGTVVQTDGGNGPGAVSNNLIHSAAYVGTVVGVGGTITFSHNCAFTPKAGFLATTGVATQMNWNGGFGTNGFTATQAQFTSFGPGGGFTPNGTPVPFLALFLG